MPARALRSMLTYPYKGLVEDPYPTFPGRLIHATREQIGRGWDADAPSLWHRNGLARSHHHDAPHRRLQR
jgi:hypothetical protein